MSNELEYPLFEGVPIGHVVRRNGITLFKPEDMDESYWYKYEAPRCGKFYGAKVGKKDILYGELHDNKPVWDPEELDEEECSSCKL